MESGKTCIACLLVCLFVCSGQHGSVDTKRIRIRYSRACFHKVRSRSASIAKLMLESSETALKVECVSVLFSTNKDTFLLNGSLK